MEEGEVRAAALADPPRAHLARPEPVLVEERTHPVEHEERGLSPVPAPAVSTMSSDGILRSYGAMRRRLYLMRHGAVSYFSPDGKPVHPEEVSLNDEGRTQADAAHGFLSGVELDRVLTSGLPRTAETARSSRRTPSPRSGPSCRSSAARS